MNPDKVRKLEQMGLGPVWQRRAAPSAEVAAPAVEAEPDTRLSAGAGATLPHAPALADDIAGMDWDTLEASIRQCTRCRLCEGRHHAVPGVGDRNARWLFVGEGPGRNEDLQGEPFVGPAGKLLDNMMRALDLARGENTYIANIVKCRPVGPDGRDRPPAADEVSACLPYLQRQMALIRPDVIVALGKTAAVSLLGLPEDTTLGSLRGPPRSMGGVPLVITYHPAYLLRKPADKAKTWRDLCVAHSAADGR
jgi:DNA polymerase